MHALANPRRFLGIARPLTPWLFWPGVALILLGSLGGLFLAPADYLQGDSFRILYIHVPAAWLGMAGWSGMTVAAVVQLVWRHPLAGIAGRATAAPGALFTAICLSTGSLWGRRPGALTGSGRAHDLHADPPVPVSGAISRWPGPARTMRKAAGASKVTALFALVGAINLPIIHYSVVWWNSLHQGSSISLTGGSKIAGSMVWPLGLTVLGFSLWFGAIVLLRMRAILAENRIEARQRRMARV